MISFNSFVLQMRKNEPQRSSRLPKVARSAIAFTASWFRESWQRWRAWHSLKDYVHTSPAFSLLSGFPSKSLTWASQTSCLLFRMPHRAGLTWLCRKEEERASRLPPEPWGYPVFLQDSSFLSFIFAICMNLAVLRVALGTAKTATALLFCAGAVCELFGLW